MIFFTVFVSSFMSADYLITGSVTNTWIGIAILLGVVSAVVRWSIGRMLDLAYSHWVSAT